MILYDPSIPISLFAYGIQIPIHDSRAARTFERLKTDPRLAPASAWHRNSIDTQVTRDDVARVHAPKYVQDLFTDRKRLTDIIMATYELIDADGKYHRYDPDGATKPLTDLFQRTLRYAAATAECATLALEHGFCYAFSGGMHHAHPAHGSGFCLINDIVIAARKLQAERDLKRVWVIDTDAHKGDGTAAATAGDDTIVTLSIHMARGWPLDAPPTFADGSDNPAHIPSDIDIPIAAGEEPVYLARLQQGLTQLEAGGSADLAIVVSGADPYENDALPSASALNLSLGQLMERDQMVYAFLKQRAIPTVYLMAGGYGEDVWKVFAQFLTWVLPQEGFGR